MPENVPLYYELTTKEFITYMAELKMVKRNERKETSRIFACRDVPPFLYHGKPEGSRKNPGGIPVCLSAQRHCPDRDLQKVILKEEPSKGV